MLGCKLLKRLLLGEHGLCSGVVNLEVHKTQSGEVVHKNSAIPVRLLCERPLQLGKKAHLCCFIWLTETISPGLATMKIL
jgi:hypothetical protein